MQLAERIELQLARLGVGEGDRIGAAVSGGADSIALMSLLAHRLAHVLHVDHKLRDDSHADAAFVSNAASDLALDHTVLETPIEVGRGESIEAAAREGRYAALEREAERLGLQWVCTAHTRDDQAETVLLRALRGSGTGGLAGIAPVRGIFVRPLLDVSRDELREHLEASGIAWREDPTNADVAFERNWLRRVVMPAITRRRPGAARSLARLADLSRSDAAVLDALADEAFSRTHSDERGVLVDVGALPTGIAARVVRKALWSLGAEPHAVHVDEILTLQGRMTHRDLVIERLPEGLAIARSDASAPEPLVVEPYTEVTSEDWGLRVRIGPPAPIARRWRSALPSGSSFVLRSRIDGDRVTTKPGTRKVQDVLTDAKVPRILRDLVPVVASPGGAIAVVGFSSRPDPDPELVIDAEPLDGSWSREIVWSRAGS